MNSFEQLHQEANTRETIRGYRKDHPPVTHARLVQVKKEFGEKHPGEIEMWRTVWDDFNIDYDTGIPESYLPKAIRNTLGLSEDKATDAVNIGKEFDLLIEGDPANTIDLQYDTESGTILRLVLPTERPDLYCDDVEQFADRDEWAKMWDAIDYDKNKAFDTVAIKNLLDNMFDISTEQKAKAAIQVGTMSESIIENDDGYILSGERPKKYWLEMWQNENNEYESTLSKKRIEAGIAVREMVKVDKAAKMIEDAVERGELYNPPDADDNELLINDPSSEDGPEIERKVGIDTDDDVTDNDDGGSPQQATNSDSADSTATSESRDAETSSSENGTVSGSDTSSSDGQPATVDDNNTGDDTTPDHSTTDAEENDDTSTLGVEIEEFKRHVEQPSPEQLLKENDDMRELEAYNQARPPYEFRVREAMKAAIEFFHDHLDEKIPENIEWNENNPDAGYRKPETPREYFRGPQYDDNPAAAYQINTRPDIAATEGGPEKYDISAAASSRLSNDTASNDSSSTNSEGEDGETIIPYNLETRDNRGWSPETIKAKKLGWAPRDMDSLRDHLRSEGFSDTEMLATGLFNLTDDGKLLPFIQARYILPYFDKEGEPVFLISRSTDTDIPGDKDGDGPDSHSESKYIKPKESQLTEPIYGSQTIQEGQPLVITEGITDAITAHEHGIPCISPVTKQFETRHYPFLERLILENDVPQVFIIQNADQPANSVGEKFTPDYDPTASKYNIPPSKVGDDEESSDLHDALTTKQKGPGFEGALRAAQHLDAVARKAGSKSDTNSSGDQLPVSKWEMDRSNADEIGSKSGGSGSDASGGVAGPTDTTLRAFETYLIELPRFGGMKYDLDDYLSDNMGQLAPPAIWAAQINDTTNDTPEWMQRLKTEGDIEYSDLNTYDDVQPHRYPSVGTDRKEFNSNSQNDTLTPAEGILNYLPTIGPNSGTLSPAVSQSSSCISPGDVDGVTDHKRFALNREMYSLKFRDITGHNKGFCGKSPFGHYGDSEDYFCVISDEIAYCHKRDAAYTPSTAVLVAEGERRADDPGGSFSPKEIFIYWRHLKERGILDAKIPRWALIYYALEHDVMTQDNLMKLGGGESVYHAKLPVDKKIDILAKIEEDHEFDLVWENYDSEVMNPDTNGESGTPRAADKTRDGESNSGASTESKAGQSAASGEQSASGQSGASGGSESATSSADESNSGNDTSQTAGVKIGGDTSSDGAATGDDQPTSDDDDEMPPEAGDVEGGAKSSDIFDDIDEIDSDSDSDASDAAGDSAESDGATTFHTYEAPDLSNPSIDVDIDAVAQFIEHHVNADEDTEDTLATPTDTMINVFTEWAVMNNIDLDQLDPSLAKSNRKGNLTLILKDGFDIEKNRVRDDDNNLVYMYQPISLRDDIVDII